MQTADDPGEQLRLARLLYADGSAGARGDAVFGLYLDLALASLEMSHALREEFPARESFHTAMDILRASRRVGPWLYNGAAHAGWTAIALSRFTGTAESALDAVDQVVLGWLADFPADRDVDLPTGLLGLGVYGLVHPSPAVRRTITAQVLDVIDARVEDDDGIFVRLVANPPRLRLDPHLVGQRDLGVAHGNAGLVSYLASVVMSDLPERERAEVLLREALRWLLRQRSDGLETVFPSSVEMRYATSRSAWCYGDPGVSLALTLAAAALEDAEAAAAARQAAAAAVARPPTLTRVMDGCLCHGAAGLCWFGRRAATDFGLPGGAGLVAHWSGYLSEQRSRGPLIYRSVEGEHRNATFLEGDLGAALALMYVATGVRPFCWEQRLLVVPVTAPAAAGAG
jgi:class I lanthipeptide synthase